MRRILPLLLALGSGCLAASGQAPAPQERPAVLLTAAQLAKALDLTGSVVLTGVRFEPGTATLAPESHAALAEVGTLMKTSSALRLEIQGHTHSAGAGAASLTLSQARAAVVRDYLVETLGVPPGRLTAVGYGATRPPADDPQAPDATSDGRIELKKLPAQDDAAGGAPPAEGPGEWTGRIAAGMMAIGGETTGIVLVTPTGDRFELRGADAATGERLRDLDGQTVTVRGRLDVTPGVEVPTRRIITVTGIE